MEVKFIVCNCGKHWSWICIWCFIEMMDEIYLKTTFCWMTQNSVQKDLIVDESLKALTQWPYKPKKMHYGPGS